MPELYKDKEHNKHIIKNRQSKQNTSEPTMPIIPTEAPTIGEKKARKAQQQQNNQASTKDTSTVLDAPHTQWHQQLLLQNKSPVEKRENKKNYKQGKQNSSEQLMAITTFDTPRMGK